MPRRAWLLFDQRALFCNPDRSPMVAKCHRSSLASSSHPTVSKAHHPRLSVSFPCRFCPSHLTTVPQTCINKTKSLHHRVSAPGPKWVCECFSRATMGLLYIRPTAVLGHPRRSSRALSVKLRYSDSCLCLEETRTRNWPGYFQSWH